MLLSFYIKKEMVGWSRFALHRANNCLFNNAFRLCSRQHNIGHPQTIRLCSTENKGPKILSRKDQLKRAVSQYGSTVIVFHVGISLVSLGFFYLVVSRYIIQTDDIFLKGSFTKSTILFSKNVHLTLVLFHFS